MTRLLTWLGHVIPRHPRRVAAAVVLPALLLGAAVLVVPRDLGFSGILDLDDPAVTPYVELNEQLNLGGRMLLLLEGDDDALDRAASILHARVETHDAVAWLTTAPPTGWLERRAPYLVERAVFDDWLALATHPEDRAATERLVDALVALDEEEDPLRRPGLLAVVVQMTNDPLNVEMGGADFLKIDARLRDVMADVPVTASWAGVAAASGQDQSRVFRKIAWMTPLSLLLVLAILRLAEPRLRQLGAVAVAMALAAGATLGATGLALGQITQGEAFFGVLVFGLGIDFALHLLTRLREERAGGADLESALVATMTGTGRGVVAGALTTAGAFAIAAMAPDPMATHLGFSGAVGLVICLALMLTLLPAAAVVLARRADAPAPAVALRFALVHRVSAAAERRPGVTVALAVVLVVGAIAGTPRFRYETDLSKVFSREVPVVQTMDRVSELFGVHSAPWVVPAADLEEARRVGDAIAASPSFDEVRSLADLLPGDTQERADALRAARPAVERRLAALRAMAGLPLAGGAVQAPIDLLERLQQATADGAPTLDDLPPEIARDALTPDGRVLVQAWTPQPHWDGMAAKAQRKELQEIHPDAASFTMLLELTMAADRPWVRGVLYGIAGLVLLVLFVDLRRPRDVLLALAPVACGATFTFGVLCWMGIGFNVMTALVVPLLIGLGVDDGIHVVHRIREHPDRPPSYAATAVGTAIVLTTATTSASFAVFGLSDHPGMESMALSMVIGLPACLLASIALVPALHLLLPGRGRE